MSFGFGFFSSFLTMQAVLSEFEIRKTWESLSCNGKVVQVMGQGDLSVKLTHGGLLELKDVKFIPKLNKSLISVIQIATSGHKVVFDSGS